MKCQNLSSGKNKKNVVSWSSAELAQRLVKVKGMLLYSFPANGDLSSADNLCKQFGPRLGLTKYRA